MERKRAADKEELERKKAALDDLSEDGNDESVREFARRQGVDAGTYDGDSVMVWGILEGQPAKASACDSEPLFSISIDLLLNRKKTFCIEIVRWKNRSGVFFPTFCLGCSGSRKWQFHGQ